MKEMQQQKKRYDEDEDFENLECKEEDFKDNYEFHRGCVSKTLLLSQTFDSVLSIRKNFSKRGEEGQPQKSISIEDVPNITSDDDSKRQGQNMFWHLECLMNEEIDKEVTIPIIRKLVWKTWWRSILYLLFIYFIEAACRLGFSILLKILFQEVKNLGQTNVKKCYMLALIVGILWLSGKAARHNAAYETHILTKKMISAFIMLMYKKLSKLTQSIAKKQQTGKIINMISGDFNLVEIKSPIFFSALVLPFVIIGITVILVTRLGWAGIIGPLVASLLVPLQFMIGKINGNLIKNTNIHKDERIKICTEIIEGINYIKLYGWQIAFKHLIQNLRKKQISSYMKLTLGRSFERALGISIALWSGLICFVVMQFSGESDKLTFANIFSTLQILAYLKLILFSVGIAGSFWFQLKVIFTRFVSILNIPEPVKDENKKMQDKQRDLAQQIRQQKQNEYEIKIDDVNGSWGLQNIYESQDERDNDALASSSSIRVLSEGSLALKNINLSIKKGELIGIGGRIGSGKSTLLSLLLDEIPFYSGKVLKKGSIAYVQQEPIMFSATIRENIIFGTKFNEDLYRYVLRKSCFSDDLKILQKGDDTMVGERGTTLSGGQKARLALARALYADADIYLLDDPISAVDSKVARKIFEKVILEMQGKKTILFVTHHVSYFHQCDRVIIMEGGEIKHFDTPAHLSSVLYQMEHSSQEIQIKKSLGLNMNKASHLGLVQGSSFIDVSMAMSEFQMPLPSETEGQKKKEEMKVEQRVKVTWKTYIKYIFHCSRNNWMFPIALICFFTTEIFNLIYYRYLAAHTVDGGDAFMFWTTLGMIQLMYFFFMVLKFFLMSLIVLNSNKKIHDDMIESLLRSPSSYFDVTSSGQLTNKLSNDLSVMDNIVPMSFIEVGEGLINIGVMMITIVAIDLFLVLPALIDIVFLVWFFFFCKEVIVACKQLDLQMKSPVFGMVRETILGLVQIRIYRRRPAFLDRFSKLLNYSARAHLSFWNTLRAFAVNLSYVSTILFTIGFLLGIWNVDRHRDSTERAREAGLYGVTILYLIQISDQFYWLLRQLICIESIMLSVERAYAVIGIPSEKSLTSQEVQPVEKKPEVLLKLENFYMCYRPELPFVLKNLSMTIHFGEKVGVVGRTGAGKSSIIKALFRIAEPELDSIFEYDGKDALKLGLHDLRHSISVLPQTPFLFNGTIKENLDPLYQKDDEQVWEALKKVNLHTMMKELPEKLQTSITDISSLLSVGQKQLLCLARALLSNNKLLILDEATANIDLQTERFIQDCIHTKFSSTAVITIAHRLNTIANYDTIFVMDKGEVAEKGTPHELILKKGIFAKMVRDAGKNGLVVKEIAELAYNKKYGL